MTDWIERCPACDMPFELKPIFHWPTKPIEQWQTGMPFPPLERIEVVCVSGHSFNASETETTAEHGMRFKPADVSEPSDTTQSNRPGSA